MRKLLCVFILIVVFIFSGCQSKLLYIDMEVGVIGEVDKKGMAPFESNGKWGYLSVEDGIILNPDYDRVSPFMNGYAIIQNDSKSQLIDRTGAFVLDDWIEASIEYNTDDLKFSYFNGNENIRIEVEQIEESDPEIFGYQNLWVDEYEYIFDNGKANLVHKESGTILFDEYYEFLREAFTKDKVNDDKYYFIISNGNMVGIAEVTDGSGRIIEYGEYETVVVHESQSCLVFESTNIDYENGKERWVFNTNGDLLIKTAENLQISTVASNNRLAFKKNGVWGYIDSYNGEIVIEPRFAKASDFINGYALVKENIDGNSLMIIDNEGDIVIRTKQ